MREINRSQYLRGTKAWPLRNYFLFGTIGISLLIGVASIVLMPEKVEKARQRMQLEKELNQQMREKVLAIQQRRIEQNLEKKEH